MAVSRNSKIYSLKMNADTTSLPVSAAYETIRWASSWYATKGAPGSESRTGPRLVSPAAGGEKKKRNLL